MADLLIKILDALFKDGASGQLLFSRVAALIIVLLIGLLWFKGETLMGIYRDSKYQQYSNILDNEKDAKFTTTVQEQIQYVHISSGADLTAIYTFRPKNLNYFVDMVSYQGKLPDIVDPKNLGGFPIDRGSEEYQTELSGGYYHTNEEFTFIPSKLKRTKEISYMFSCPYFNLDNVYSGSVEMYWFENKPEFDTKRLFGICGQAARALGRAK